MRKMDMHWMSKREWWEFKNHIPVVREDAPTEAQQSYKNFMIDAAAVHIVDSWQIGEYTVLELEDETPLYPYNKYWINGAIYDIVPIYDIGKKCIAVKTDETDMKHRLVKFILVDEQM